MKINFRKFLANVCDDSLIVRAIRAVINWFYRLLGSGLFASVFSGYDSIRNAYAEGAVGGALQKSGGMGAWIAQKIEESCIVRGISSFMRMLGHLPICVFGAFFSAFGMFSLLAQIGVHLIAGDLSGIRQLSFWLTWEVLLSVGLLLLGVPLLFYSDRLHNTVGNSAFFKPLAVRFLGFREQALQTEIALPKKLTGAKLIAFVFGAAVGSAAYYVPPFLLLGACIAIPAAYCVLLYPEFGYYCALFILPFLILLPHPSILLALLVLYTYFSFLCKRIRRKRLFRPEFADICVFLFMILTAFGGLVSFGGMQSLEAAGIYTVLMLGYFLTVGLMDSKEKLTRAVNVLALSAFFVALYGIYQNFTGDISEEWIDTDMFDSIAGRVVSTFENPNMLGVYLITLFPMILALAFSAEKRMRISYWVTSLTCLICLIYTWARGAWLGFLLSAVLFLLILDRRTLGLIVAGIAALPFMLPYLPASIVSRFSSIGNLADTSTNYRVYIWRGSVNMLKEYYLTGIGIGEKAFHAIYPYYSFAGIEKAPHSHNLFLQILLSLGIFGFLIFLVLTILLLQNGFTLSVSRQDNRVRLIGCGAMCGVFATLLQGMTDYVWYNYRVFFLFWITFGIAIAAGRVDHRLRMRGTAEQSPTSGELLIWRKQ